MKENAPPSAPARLSVLLADQAPYAVIFRRGPTRQVAVIGWDLLTDKFKLGQWLKGRIHLQYCDLSPDGKHLIYFADKFNPRTLRPGGYTVVSRAPYLKALHIWQQPRYWFYGGGFLDDRRLWLYNDKEKGIVRHLPEFSRKAEAFPGEIPTNPTTPQMWRMMRRGWQKVGAGNKPWSKQQQDWLLSYERREPNFYAQQESYTVRNLSTEDNFNGAKWEWADFDTYGQRLLWAAGGKLFAAKIGEGGHGEPVELANFNAMVFEPKVAPY